MMISVTRPVLEYQKSCAYVVVCLCPLFVLQHWSSAVSLLREACSNLVQDGIAKAGTGTWGGRAIAGVHFSLQSTGCGLGQWRHAANWSATVQPRWVLCVCNLAWEHESLRAYDAVLNT